MPGIVVEALLRVVAARFDRCPGPDVDLGCRLDLGRSVPAYRRRSAHGRRPACRACPVDVELRRRSSRCRPSSASACEPMSIARVVAIPGVRCFVWLSLAVGVDLAGFGAGAVLRPAGSWRFRWRCWPAAMTGGRFLFPSVFSLRCSCGVGASLPMPWRSLPQIVGPPLSVRCCRWFRYRFRFRRSRSRVISSWPITFSSAKTFLPFEVCQRDVDPAADGSRRADRDDVDRAGAGVGADPVAVGGAADRFGRRCSGTSR